LLVLLKHRSKSGLQYPVELVVGDCPYGASKCALIRAAVGFLERALVVFCAFDKRDGPVEIQIVIYNRIKVVRQLLVFDDIDDARNGEVRLATTAAR
jgi:hypothetical protein